MSVTAGDIIRRALVDLRVIDPGESVQAGDGQYALEILNAMLRTLGATSIYIYAEGRQLFSLTPSQQDYDLGTGGDFNMARPAKITAITVIPNPGTEIELDMLSESGWRDIQDKTLTSSYPTAVIESKEAPLNVLTFWPVPTGSQQVAIYYWQEIQQFSALSDVVECPNAYEDLMQTELMRRLAPSYGKSMPQEAMVTHHQAKYAIERMNFQLDTMSMWPELLDNDSPSKKAVQSRGYVID